MLQVSVDARRAGLRNLSNIVSNNSWNQLFIVIALSKIKLLLGALQKNKKKNTQEVQTILGLVKKKKNVPTPKDFMFSETACPNYPGEHAASISGDVWLSTARF